MIKGILNNTDIISEHKDIDLNILDNPNNYFELTFPNIPLKPFVDLDGKFDNEIKKEEFNILNENIIKKLETIENISLITSSHYNALSIIKMKGKPDKKEILTKLSYRITWYKEKVNNIKELKKIIYENKIKILQNLLIDTINITSTATYNALNVDSSVYRLNGVGKVRCVNAYKHPEQLERINKLIKGEIKDTIININLNEIDNYELIEPLAIKERKDKNEDKKRIKLLDNEEEKQKRLEQNENKKLTKIIEDREFTQEQIIELLDVIGNSNEEWQIFNNVGFILYNNYYDYSVFDNWCKKSKKYDTGAINERWNDNMKKGRNEKYTIYLLFNLAKKNNLEGYKLWCENNKQPHILTLLFFGVNTICDEYITDISKNLKYSNEKWYVCHSITKLWSEYKTPEKFILDYIKNLLKSCPEKIKIFEKNSFLDLFKKCLSTSLRDDNFYKKLSTPKNNIAFKNGLYDLKNKKFQKGFLPDNYICKTLSYNFNRKFKSNEENKKIIINEIKKICNNDDDYINYIFRLFGYVMTGLSSEVQEFYSFIGQKGGNGKSTLINILNNLFDIYIKTLTSKCLEADYSKSHKDFADISSYRIIFSEEFKKGKSLNEQLIKTIRDGKSMTNEIMYGTSENIELQGKLIILSNNTLDFTSDGGMSRGYREIQFNSRFVPDYETTDFKDEVLCFQSDPKFADKFKEPEYRDELLYILLDYSNKYYTDGLKTPKFIIQASKRTCELQGDNFSSFYETYIKFEKSEFLFIKDLNEKYIEIFKKSVNIKEIKDEFKKKSELIEYDKDKRSKKIDGEDKKRGGFTNIRIKTQDEIDTDNGEDKK